VSRLANTIVFLVRVSFASSMEKVVILVLPVVALAPTDEGKGRACRWAGKGYMPYKATGAIRGEQ
jgi:hypothetical protein